ncbi:hypothetical protein GQ600_128 [Phytophthora cactorum]|nr:hypothetical protein GQ600_128 [Phytophthora cactorum]
MRQIVLWESEERNGVLAVSFGEQQTAILHSPYSIFDVAVEIYSLRPCSYRGVGLVMPLELKQMHDTVYKMFNGVASPQYAFSRAPCGVESPLG